MKSKAVNNLEQCTKILKTGPGIYYVTKLLVYSDITTIRFLNVMFCDSEAPASGQL
jgi:hypothetical protein